jgi:hypothetical protein
MENKLISIGCLGMMKCYLNISNDDAITRYCKSMDIAIEEFDHTELTVFYFSEEFEAYSVYPISDNI